MTENIEYQPDEALIGQLESAIHETSRFMGVVLKDIRAFNPPPADLSEDEVFLQWTAIIDAVAEEPKITKFISGFRIGGRLSWGHRPSEQEVQIGARRSVGFSVLTGIAPERDFVYQALEASLWSQNSVILGAFIFECVNLLQVSAGNAKTSSQIWTPGKAMNVVIDKLKGSVGDTLEQVRENLKAAFDGKPIPHSPTVKRDDNAH